MADEWIVPFLVFPSGLMFMASSCRRFWFKGFAVHPEFRLLRNDDNEMQRIASSLATTKLEDLLAELIECNFVFAVSDVALCIVGGIGRCVAQAHEFIKLGHIA